VIADLIVAKYAHTISSIFIACFGNYRIKKTTCKLIHTGENNSSAKSNNNQHARITNEVQQF